MADLFGGRRRKNEADAGLLAQWFARDEDELAVWKDIVDGPSTDELATRLSSVPRSFLDERVAIRALAGDVLDLEPASGVFTLAAQIDAGTSSAARRAAAIALWLWASEEEVAPFSVPLHRQYLERALAALAFRLAPIVDPGEWISDAERRDEAVRTFLLWSGQRPAGEADHQAEAMLAMRDSLQHSRALADALRDQQHRLEVTARLNAARAKEAAARYSSE